MRKMIFGFVTSAEDEKTSKTEKIKSDSGNMNTHVVCMSVFVTSS